MDTVFYYIEKTARDITTFIKLIQASDYIDIFLTAIIIYYMISWLRETRAMQLVKGILVLFIVLVLSDWSNLTVLHYLLNALVQVGTFAIVVIFQPELRSLLERMGRSRVGKILDFATADGQRGDADEESKLEGIINAVMNMALTKTGALIVLERETRLGDHTMRGTRLDAEVSRELLENIFFKNSPLHDGAVIISDGRIHSAGCFLPLSSNSNLSSELGTRHRAALGISEVSDALIIVVSEETGRISIAMGGALTRNLSKEPLRRALKRFLKTEEENTLSTFGQFLKFKRGGAGNAG